MAIITEKENIDLARFVTLDLALGLEMKGLRRSRGRTAYAIIKDELELKGNRQKVSNQLKVLIKEKKELLGITKS